LIDYAHRLGNAGLEARLGYLLEAPGRPTNGLTPPTGPVRLDPRRLRRGDYHSRRRLYRNVPPEALSPQESAEIRQPTRLCYALSGG
jgi:predicted transcriptional regulator of viral defense system